MKKLHKLVLKSYIGPFFITFFIALFLILMQFLWKFIDDLVGKGLEWYIIGELLFYASGTFVPLALPLAVLLSSIMTMGNMGEHYELVAFKSAGISLRKIMMPLIAISFFLVIIAFFFSNNVLPVANLRMLSLLYDVRQQRPALNITEGVYFRGIDNYVIKISEKKPDGETLEGIKIYDHTDRRGNVNLTVAESGSMIVTPDRNTLIFTLYNGTNYQEVRSDNPFSQERPFQRTSFEEQVMRFDLGIFELRRTDQELFKTSHQMLRLDQLIVFEDSISNEIERRKNAFFRDYITRIHYLNTSAHENFDSFAGLQIDFSNVIDSLPMHRANMLLERAQSLVRTNKEHSYFMAEELRQRNRALARYKIEFHRKFTLSLACVVLFLIGAPLGAIIRKGGFGLPVVISVFFFVIFHVISISGEKFVREGVLEAHIGMWIAPMVLLPVGIWLTIKASTDSSIMDAHSYKKNIEKLLSYFKRKINFDSGGST
ncbi:MAG TPA: LptF/LptG family permease [Bacteroidales bacterium]|nr:LptF/LptG family permease [Bacteroidales bacterium]